VTLEPFPFGALDSVQGVAAGEGVQVVVQSQHLLSLFTDGGTELDDKKTAKAAGVEPGMLLVLRQSTVKGVREHRAAALDSTGQLIPATA
jgi:hypothetical protein